MASFYYTVTSILLLFLLSLPPILLYRRLRLHLPPSPPSLPVVGHLHHLLLSSSPPHHVLARLAARLNTSILYLRLGRVPTVVVSSPSLARAVLKIHDAALASRPRLLSAVYLSLGCSDVTFSPLGPYWRQARRICVAELLSPRRIPSFCHLRRQELRRLLLAVSSSSDPIDMSARFLRLANDVLCMAAFGRRLEDAGGGRLAEVLTEAQDLFAGFTVADFFPGLQGFIGAVTGLTRRLVRTRDDLRAVCNEIIAYHESRRKLRSRSESGDVDEGEDFLDVLLRLQKSPDLEVPITEDNLKALVLDMFVAGTDTTSSTLEWVMTELAANPSVMAKAQSEVRALVGARAAVDESNVDRLPYMKAVIKETFRLHPPVPLLVPRESIEPCVIDGYDVQAGARVLVNTYSMGRDTRTWGEDALLFDPARFLRRDVDMKGLQEFELLPFGGGRRGCPGYPFAMVTVGVTLASLLYHFDWALPPGVFAGDIDMSEVFGLATRKREPLVLVATAKEGYEFNL